MSKNFNFHVTQPEIGQSLKKLPYFKQIEPIFIENRNRVLIRLWFYCQVLKHLLIGNQNPELDGPILGQKP